MKAVNTVLTAHVPAIILGIFMDNTLWTYMGVGAIFALILVKILNSVESRS